MFLILNMHRYKENVLQTYQIELVHRHDYLKYYVYYVCRLYNIYTFIHIVFMHKVFQSCSYRTLVFQNQIFITNYFQNKFKIKQLPKL